MFDLKSGKKSITKIDAEFQVYNYLEMENLTPLVFAQTSFIAFRLFNYFQSNFILLLNIASLKGCTEIALKSHVPRIGRICTSNRTRRSYYCKKFYYLVL